MNTLLLLFISSISLFSDVEISSVLPAHHHRVEQVAVDEGHWGIEVLAEHSSQANLTCVYSHLGEVLSKQEHTNHCYISTNETLPVYLSVDVINNSSSTVHYKVRAYSLMNLK